jgi:hypothetical protein
MHWVGGGGAINEWTSTHKLKSKEKDFVKMMQQEITLVCHAMQANNFFNEDTKVTQKNWSHKGIDSVGSCKKLLQVEK